MTTARNSRALPAGRLTTAVIVALVGTLNLGYAGWRVFQGRPADASLPLVISGVLCLALAMILLILARQPSPR